MNAFLRGFKSVYIFTVLDLSLLAVLWVLTHTAGGLGESATTILTAISGGLITHIGTIIAHEFREQKRDAAARASDSSTNTTQAAPPAT